MPPTTLTPRARPARPRPARLRRLAHETVTLALPVDFLAFHELHHRHYLRWALLRLHGNHDRARHTVQSAFGDIAMHWPAILADPSPAHQAWRLLQHRLDTDRRPPAGTATGHHHSGGGGEGDTTVLLHHALHLTETDIATLTGTPLPTVRYHLHTRHRP